MKRSIILLLVLLPIVAFSQMQNIINQGNTATTQRRVGGNNTIDSSLIKIRSIDAHRLLVSMPDVVIYSNSIFLFYNGNKCHNTINLSKFKDL
jgi:hypothetical protein